MQMPEQIFGIFPRLFEHLMENLINTLNGFFPSFFLNCSLLFPQVPVEIQLTNSLEGMPYIINCWEVEEAKGQRFSRNLLHFLSNYIWGDNEVFTLSSCVLSCHRKMELGKKHPYFGAKGEEQ